VRRFAPVLAVPTAFALLAVAIGGSVSSSTGSPVAHAAITCGIERWPIKTLSDPDVGKVNFNPRDSSVGRLGKKTAPHVSSSTPRIDGVETTTYRVQARLVEFKREDDRDVHLVIAVPSDSAKTMIVEFPDTACPGANGSPKKKQMGAARSALISACGTPSSSSFHKLKGTATVTGVGFWDVPHGQTGRAPNSIELHPVLRFSSSNCSAP
jgi:hypothetical protein